MAPKGPGRPPGTTHDRIRDVALELFVAHGYAGTSLTSIAAAAGISRTTLFAYFPAKRDLLWEEVDRRAARADAVLEPPVTGPLVDTIFAAMLEYAHYDAEEHDAVASRMRVIDEDEELRAYTALAVQTITNRIALAASGLRPNADPELVQLVTRALMGAGAHCTQTWAASPTRTPLDAYTAEHMRPIVDALRPLLP